MLCVSFPKKPENLFCETLSCSTAGKSGILVSLLLERLIFLSDLSFASPFGTVVKFLLLRSIDVVPVHHSSASLSTPVSELSSWISDVRRSHARSHTRISTGALFR